LICSRLQKAPLHGSRVAILLTMAKVSIHWHVLRRRVVNVRPLSISRAVSAKWPAHNRAGMQS
jgi:hypothetical protein